MAANPDKKTEALRVYVSEALELELRRMAEDDNRSLSEYIAVVLRRHVYGYRKPPRIDGEGPDKAD